MADTPGWVGVARVLGDAVAACGVLLAVGVTALTMRGTLGVAASGDLLGVAGGLLVAAGVVLHYFIDFAVASRRFTALGFRLAAPCWVAGLACLGASGYLLR